MGLLDKIIGAVTGKSGDERDPVSGLTSDQIKELAVAISFLDKVQPGLAEQALDFVVKGDNVAVLITLSGLPANNELDELLGKPGRLRWAFGLYDQKAKFAEIQKGLAARSHFYGSLDAAHVPVDVLVRLGKLLAAADNGRSLETTGANIPQWLQYLINDVWFSSPNKPLELPEAAKQRAAWTPELLVQLLVREELDPLLAFDIIFERKGIDSYYHGNLNSLVYQPAVSTYMLANTEVVSALAARLSASGKMALANRIGRDKVLSAEFARVLVGLAADGSKTVRAEAVPHLEGIEPALRLQMFTELLRSGDSTQRAQVADLLVRLPQPNTREVLESALDAEASKPVQQAIRTALTRLDAVDDAAGTEMPEPPPFKLFGEVALGEDMFTLMQSIRDEVLERAREAAEAEKEENQSGKNKYKWRQEQYGRLAKIGDKELRLALEVLNGKGGKTESELLRRNQVATIFDTNKKFFSHPGMDAVHIIRWHDATGGWNVFWMNDGFQSWLRTQAQGSVDLRSLAELVTRMNISTRGVAQTGLSELWNAPSSADILPADQVWPFFWEHPQYIDEALGLIPSPETETRYSAFNLANTLRTLSVFPQIPARWLPSIMEMALGEGKTYRSAAQKVMAKLPDIGRRVVDSLTHSKSEVRIEAAKWLADLKYTEAIAAFNEALKKETRETVRAAFLTSLEALGEDIAPRLAPAILLAEAKKGLKAKPPSGLAWFSMDNLPAVRWADGSAVEPEIIQWWIVLATKLKEPAGNALLTRYMSLLDAPSRQQLGSTVLRQFIAQDARHPSMDEGIAHAKTHAPSRYQQYQDSYNSAKPEYREWYEVNFAKSQDQVFEEVRREKMSEYLGSAIGEKGMLALTMHVPGHEAVSMLQQYMRDNFQRRSQIEAMLDGLAPGNDPLVIQMMLGLARRYRTAAVQEKARTLVQQIAERNGWTQDQLADRTIPTAGLDDTGTLNLQFGDRVFTMVLDGAMKPELRNPDGKVIKALPEARQNDDAAQIKEAKSLFSTSKKELKQVIDGQVTRLFEAMCSGRVWPVGEWREYLHSHPIAGRLIQRLVWLQVDAQGVVLASFRPTEDGSLINTEDDEVELPDDALVRLAHASLVAPDQAKAWVAHFKDYKLTPLFAQMTRESPAVAFKDENGHSAKSINDREGWVSDTFTLRGAFTKLGYQRAQAEDGGFFYEYTKDFASTGVRVVMEFSGNTLPEENVSAALKTLRFDDMGKRSWGDNSLALEVVPPVLLSEAYADYLAVAKQCTGFDAEWEKKMPW